MNEIVCPGVEEVSLDVNVGDTAGPMEIWPGDQPFPPMETDRQWDDFISRYDLSEVFGKGKLLTTSQHGYVVETNITYPMKEWLTHGSGKL
jgi:hypothetical protein